MIEHNLDIANAILYIRPQSPRLRKTTLRSSQKQLTPSLKKTAILQDSLLRPPRSRGGKTLAPWYTTSASCAIITGTSKGSALSPIQPWAMSRNIWHHTLCQPRSNTFLRDSLRRQRSGSLTAIKWPDTAITRQAKMLHTLIKEVSNGDFIVDHNGVNRRDRRKIHHAGQGPGRNYHHNPDRYCRCFCRRFYRAPDWDLAQLQVLTSGVFCWLPAVQSCCCFCIAS